MSDLMHLVSPYLMHDELRFQSLKLAPFVNSVIIYFAFVQDPHGELWTTILKCAPIVSLMIYILLKGLDLSNKYKASQRILLGLIFSCAGDVLLNIDLFPHGMGAFAIAQVCYIFAFGWTPLKWPIGLSMYIGGAVVVALVFRFLDEVLVFGLPIYAGLLLTMCWRAVARASEKKDFLSVFCAVGSVFFVISDGLICVNMFLKEVPHARLWIMTTYYLAQLAITVSTAKESKVTKTSVKLLKSSEKVKRKGKTKD